MKKYYVVDHGNSEVRAYDTLEEATKDIEQCLDGSDIDDFEHFDIIVGTKMKLERKTIITAAVTEEEGYAREN
jgi:hypothetical protein